eukprot:jgi/Bigna1/69051/fgenesh1_pg.7_\
MPSNFALLLLLLLLVARRHGLERLRNPATHFCGGGAGSEIKAAEEGGPAATSDRICGKESLASSYFDILEFRPRMLSKSQMGAGFAAGEDATRAECWRPFRICINQARKATTVLFNIPSGRPALDARGKSNGVVDSGRHSSARHHFPHVSSQSSIGILKMYWAPPMLRQDKC